ncbi:hypothetical protein QN096_14605 [Metapseudomonas otitidis]|uniref:hypothetical protein n=1 Tax=Metapseudomonas otitidis TaxID=319939 RepID=UPI0025416185|nr:hypothetical protein [Pseudomonas otitidis]WIF65018.1 hypothetical protein QN096_14605 [Pseudomonas otitidis]
MGTPRIRLYACSISFTDGDFSRSQPLVVMPRSILGSFIIFTFFGMLGVFVAGIFSGKGWMIELGLYGFLGIPFVLLMLDSWLSPEDHEEAYFDHQGLLLTFECGRRPELSAEFRISFSDIESIKLETRFWCYRGQTDEWRQYLISTRCEGEYPNVRINTSRPRYLVLRDLERIRKLPGADEVSIPHLLL